MKKNFSALKTVNDWKNGLTGWKNYVAGRKTAYQQSKDTETDATELYKIHDAHLKAYATEQKQNDLMEVHKWLKKLLNNTAEKGTWSEWREFKMDNRRVLIINDKGGFDKKKDKDGKSVKEDSYILTDVAQMLRATADLIDPSNERAKEAKRVYKQAIIDSRAFKKLKNDWELEQDEDVLSSDSED